METSKYDPILIKYYKIFNKDEHILMKSSDIINYFIIKMKRIYGIYIDNEDITREKKEYYTYYKISLIYRITSEQNQINNMTIFIHDNNNYKINVTEEFDNCERVNYMCYVMYLTKKDMSIIISKMNEKL